MANNNFVQVKSHRKRRRATAKQPAPQDTTNDASKNDWQKPWGEMDLSGWYTPYQPENPVAWEKQGRVDKLRETIPFWLANVNAAINQREMAKMEDFLNRVYDDEDSWLNSQVDDGPADPPRASSSKMEWPEEPPVDYNAWGVPEPTREDGWAVAEWPQEPQPDYAAWGVPAEEPETAPRARDQGQDTWGEDEGPEVNSFVEQVARIERINNVSKKKSMNRFFCLSNDQKVEKIQEIVDFLRNHH